MKKIFSVAVCATVIGWAGAASATPIASGPWADYEYYQYTAAPQMGYPGQFVVAGQQLTFFFDLWLLNNAAKPGGGTYNPLPPTGTDSQLTLQNDVTGYLSPQNPIASIWTAVTFLSVDDEYEQFKLDVKAFLNNTTYDLKDMYISDLGGDENSDTETLIVKWSGDLLNAWKADPYGTVKITLTSYFPSETGYNDFNLLEVGTGVAPVPEPTTMLLFGTGLLGLAAVGRRRTTTKA